MTDPLEVFRNRLDGVVESKADSFKSLCPCHADTNPSLSVSRGDKGVVMKCHACPADGKAVAEKLGIPTSDLFFGGGNGHTTMKKQTKPAPVLKTPDVFVAWLASEEKGTPGGIWTYRDHDGKPVAAIVRVNTATGKTFRPLHPVPGGWRCGDPHGGFPLYRLDKLDVTKPVYIVEGEKCADFARDKLGLNATTSAHGSKSANKTSWTPLAGCNVVIVPDADTAGEGYLADVARILQALEPPATAKVARLPGLGKSQDIVDFIEGGGTSEKLREVFDAAEIYDPPPQPKSEPAIPKKTVPTPLPYQPFPVDVMPDPCRSFVAEGAKAIGCSDSYLALPLLPAMASLIGNTRWIQLKRGHTEPPIIWTAIIGESGTKKTPAIKAVLAPLEAMQAADMATYAKERATYEQVLEDYEREKKKTKGGNPGERPIAPKLKRYIVSDITTEALVPILQDNPRGVLLYRDEASGIFAGMNEYKKGDGDNARYLSMYDGGPMLSDRKGDKSPWYIPMAAVSICGGIQPGILSRCIRSEEHTSELQSH